MNELFQTLIDCLKTETQHYKNLFNLAESQRELLMAGKVEALPENVRLEEKEVFALGPLSGRRNDVLKKLAQFYRLQKISLTELIAKCPIEIVEELKKAVVELTQAAKKLEEFNQRNEKLLNNALSYVNFTLKILADGGKKKSFYPGRDVNTTKRSFVNRMV